MDAIFRMMVIPNCSNCEFKDRQKAEMIVDFNREKQEMKDEFNRNFDDFKKSIRKEFTEEIAMLKEVCLHPKLENVAIQVLTFQKCINPLVNCNIIEDGVEFIKLNDSSFTKTKFKTMFKKLRKSRNEETHPMSSADLIDFVSDALNLIKKIDFSNVDMDSNLYFSKIVIENHSDVMDCLKDFELSHRT